MPALDPNKLTHDELVHLLNSTPLGTVITRPRFDRQMNQAGRRWHGGRHIRLLDCVRWLAEEADRPPEPKGDAGLFGELLAAVRAGLDRRHGPLPGGRSSGCPRPWG